VAGVLHTVLTQPNKTYERSERKQPNMQHLMNKKREEEGFTLIELLIVVIILGVLAAIVVFAVGNARKDSVQSSCKTSLKSVELSAEAVNTKGGSYPTAQTDMTTPAKGGLLKSWPDGGDDYTFTWAGDADTFKVTVSDDQSVAGGDYTGSNADAVCGPA
jgi:prepilin-type N-terminal cleavage/methylation domain-containing protein